MPALSAVPDCLPPGEAVRASSCSSVTFEAAVGLNFTAGIFMQSTPGRGLRASAEAETSEQWVFDFRRQKEEDSLFGETLDASAKRSEEVFAVG